jgi:hypothetical protein
MACNANCRCCKGACCCGSQCTQETCQDCEDAHGVWAGPGTQCANEECDQPTGACCGEACAILSECECLQGGGEYQGDDTTCSPDPCGGCSGPCDGENPCPEGCECVDGECVGRFNVCKRIFVVRECTYVCAAIEPGCGGDTTFTTFGPYSSYEEALLDALFNTDNWCPETINRDCCLNPEDPGTAYLNTGCSIFSAPVRFAGLLGQGVGCLSFYEQEVPVVGDCCSGSCEAELWRDFTGFEEMLPWSCLADCACVDGACENPLP